MSLPVAALRNAVRATLAMNGRGGPGLRPEGPTRVWVVVPLRGQYNTRVRRVPGIAASASFNAVAFSTSAVMSITT